MVQRMSDPLYLSSESESPQARHRVIGADMTFRSWMMIDCAFSWYGQAMSYINTLLTSWQCLSAFAFSPLLLVAPSS